MQLSASASFPELLTPAPSGELPVDGLAAAGSGGDFAALVAGLVDAPAGPVTVPAEPEVPAPGLSAEASLLAAFAAFLPTLSPAPTAPLSADGALTADPESADASQLTDAGLGRGTDGGRTLLAAGLFASAGAGLGVGDARVAVRPGQLPAAPVPPVAALAAPTAEGEGALPVPAATIAPTAVLPAPAAPAAAALATAQVPLSAQVQAAVTAASATGAPTESAGTPGEARPRRATSATNSEALPRPANFAAERPADPIPDATKDSASKENFLIIGEEEVAESKQGLGTGVALREGSMTTSAPTTPSPAFLPPVSGLKDAIVSAAGFTGFDAQAELPESIERMAHRAVEAVAATLERGAAQPAHSVNLKFSVQGADLMVRVALRAEEVQVTFRTESAELRQALAQEWQTVRGRDPESVLQAITPVFTSSDSGHSTSSQGGREGAGSFAQMQAQADAHSQRQFARQFGEAPAAFPGALPGVPAAAAPVAGRMPATEPSVGSRLLHTFA